MNAFQTDELLDDFDDKSTISSHSWKVEQALKKHGKAIFNFWHFLHDFPLLGLNHQIGKKIIQEFKNCPRTMLGQSYWYRANQNKEFLKTKPSHVLIPDQRYNSGGQQYLYLSNNDKCAVAESTYNKTKKTSWVQRFEVDRLENILDLSPWNEEDLDVDERDEKYSNFFTALIFSDLLTQCPEHYFFGETQEKIKWNPAYLMPRFIADAAKYCGFSGVLYSSIRLNRKNLVVFNSDWNPKADGDSYELTLTQEDLIIEGNFLFNQGERSFVLGAETIEPLNH